MRRTRWCITVVLAAWLCAGAAQAAIIADYQADYLPGTVNGQTRPAVAADGWDYMWNIGGAIGNSANYTSLMWWSGQSHYNRDGAGNLPRANPCAWANLNATGGHPGQGTTQGAGVDRYAIAAYTVQPGEGGVLSITNSSIAVPSASSNGVELRVYVNNNLMATLLRTGGGAASTFDRLLCWVNPGDRVFVAGGPNTADGSDSFNWSYRLETGADANVLVWDADGTAPIGGGAGGWDATNARWVANAGSGGYVAWNNASNYTALFPATGGTVTLDVPVTARGVVFSANGYTLSGSNALTLTGSGSGGAGPAVLAVSDATYTATISAPVLASTSVTRLDAGTLILQGNNSITGNLRIGGGNTVLAGTSVTNVTGTVQVGLSPTSSGVLGTYSGTLTIQDNATLTAPYIYMGENNVSIQGLTAVINQTGGTVTLTGLDGEGNAIRIGHWPAETSTYNLSGGTLTTTNPTAEVALAIDGTGIFNLSGTGVLNTYRFVVNARNAAGSGTFNVTGGTANIGAGGIVNESTGPAVVNLGGGTIRATANFSSSLNMTLTGTGGNVTFDTNGYTITLTGALTGPGGLTKVGAGNLILNNASNNFGGATSVQGGILDALTGNFSGNVTVGPSGGLHAGQGVIRAPLAIGGSYNQSGTLYLEVASPSSYDWLQVAGSATLGGVIDVTFTQPVTLPPGAYMDVVVATGGITDAGFSLNFSGPYTGPAFWTMLVELGGTAEALRLVASPEPSSLALLAIGGLGFLRRRQSRRQG